MNQVLEVDDHVEESKSVGLCAEGRKVNDAIHNDDSSSELVEEKDKGENEESSRL